MSTPPDAVPPHVHMYALALRLKRAAELYVQAWRTQAWAVEAWEAALAEITNQYGDGSPAAVAQALATFNAAAEGEELLLIDVGPEALQHMEAGAERLKQVAQAAEKVADALLAAAGGVQ